MDNTNSIFISAGDPSADYPGKNLIESIMSQCGQINTFGLGGPLMQEAGLKPLVDYKKLAVLGFFEILPRVQFFRELLKKVEKEIESKRPKVIILIDYPGFNLRLAKRIKKLGIPIIYYISPQVWAWGKRRIKKIKSLVDLMLVIFPFEQEFYKKHNVPVRFVGHPVISRYADMPVKSECREGLGIDSNTKLIALLPGSRLQEVKRMLPVMIDSAIKLGHDDDMIRFIIAGVENVELSFYEKIIGNSKIPIKIGKTPEIINGADLVITSSGTATIETAYFMTPMIVIYKTGWLTYHLARRLISLDTIAMVNIVAGKKIVPELIQGDATAENIQKQGINILGDNNRYNQLVKDLEEVRRQLSSEGAGKNAFEAINEVVGLC